MSNPNISICIPAFKNEVFLERLLNSIKIQSYQNFEVVITDDSPNNDLEKLCDHYRTYFDIQYHKNAENLNTPENWNEALRKAKHEWIKIMHDDDWFTSVDALKHYADATLNNPSVDFFFSAYQNVYAAENTTQKMGLSPFWNFLLRENPEVLISRNVIGPPSVTLYRKNKLVYDGNMKYVVDIDFYASYLKNSTWFYIPEVLINVGIHAAQVTKYTFGVADYHFRESILLLRKKEDAYFKNIIVYDGWWRLIRNFQITECIDFESYGLSAVHQSVLNQMIAVQKNMSSKLINIGILSKILMSLVYLKTRLMVASRQKADQ